MTTGGVAWDAFRVWNNSVWDSILGERCPVRPSAAPSESIPPTEFPTEFKKVGNKWNIILKDITDRPIIKIESVNLGMLASGSVVAAKIGNGSVAVQDKSTAIKTDTKDGWIIRCKSIADTWLFWTANTSLGLAGWLQDRTKACRYATWEESENARRSVHGESILADPDKRIVGWRVYSLPKDSNASHKGKVCYVRKYSEPITTTSTGLEYVSCWSSDVVIALFALSFSTQQEAESAAKKIYSNIDAWHPWKVVPIVGPVSEVKVAVIESESVSKQGWIVGTTPTELNTYSKQRRWMGKFDSSYEDKSKAFIYSTKDAAEAAAKKYNDEYWHCDSRWEPYTVDAVGETV